MKNYGIAIHGGAGTLMPAEFTTEKELQYKNALQQALRIGYEILQNKGSALDAVEAAVKNLEDCPLFNAGLGAVYSHEGKHELDASIMCGATLNAGAVALVSRIKNPIALARLVMEKSEHVMLCGKGAEQFAELEGVTLVDEQYFSTEQRFAQWQKAKKESGSFLDHNIKTGDEKKFGTVGAVALDAQGNLAAATSTGGMTNKKFGRLGDSPIIGAGTYANNNTCAVSCTGHGELFIRSVVAYDVSALMEYKQLSLKDACEEVVMKKLVTINGEGGLIAIDKDGNIEMPFNSTGMYRACKSSNGFESVAIFR